LLLKNLKIQYTCWSPCSFCSFRIRKQNMKNCTRAYSYQTNAFTCFPSTSRCDGLSGPLDALPWIMLLVQSRQYELLWCLTVDHVTSSVTTGWTYRGSCYYFSHDTMNLYDALPWIMLLVQARQDELLWCLTVDHVTSSGTTRLTSMMPYRGSCY